jgi:transketolase
MLGDGDSEEGMVWEALMAAAHYKLDNMVVFLDHNGLQIDGPVKEVMSPEPVGDKFRAFGWETAEIDGHDHRQIMQALNAARQTKGRPSMIVANTIKGKGLFIHGKQGGMARHRPQSGTSAKSFKRTGVLRNRRRRRRLL